MKSRYKYVELIDGKWVAVVRINGERITVAKFPKNNTGERMAHEAGALRLRQHRNKTVIDAMCVEIMDGNVHPEDLYRLVKSITTKVVLRKPSIELINDVVCEHYQLTKEDLAQKSRRRKVREPRQVAMYLMREFKHTCTEIGRYYKKDHTTVVHTHKLIRDIMEVDPEMVITVKSIQYKIAATDTLSTMTSPTHIGVLGLPQTTDNDTIRTIHNRPTQGTILTTGTTI